MRKIIPVLTLILLALPSVSSAATLTPQQSASLIAVVQSSPGTPASAFVSLIPAFSNITVVQATSLITVVQAAPNVPATAFVDLLTSFTVDTSTVQTTVTQTSAATSIPEPSRAERIEVNPQSAEILGANCGDIRYQVTIYDQYGNEMLDKEVMMNTPSSTETSKTTSENTGAGKRIRTYFSYKTQATSTTETVTFISGLLSKTATIQVGDGLQHARIMQDGSYWYEASGGMRVNPVTKMCL